MNLITPMHRPAEPAAPSFTALGLSFAVSPLAVTWEAQKPHRRRRNQSAAYHARIDKKWRKRYGLKAVPGMIVFTNPLTGQRQALIHPERVAQLRAAVAKQ